MSSSPITETLEEKVAILENFRDEEIRHRIPTAAIWSLVVTIALSGVSAVWMASATYHEVASLRATVDKWEPKIEEITKMIPLQEQVLELQARVRELELQRSRSEKP